MPSRRLFLIFNRSLLGFVLLVCPVLSIAQHHGGGHGGMGGGIPGAMNRPSGVDEKDSLKNFHQAMAMQATSQQIAEFQALIHSTEAVQAALKMLQEQPLTENAGAQMPVREPLDHALETARDGDKNFQQGFSAAQKSGLKEIVKRLEKSDSDLELEEKKLDQSLDLKAAAPEVSERIESLDKALTDFYNQELALGREMSITLANGHDIAFSLPQVKIPVSIEGRTIGVTVSGALAQVAIAGTQRTFKLELIADLSDLQQDFTGLLRTQLDSSETCGQRIAIREATLAPATPSSLMVVKLHFERWTCMGSSGQQSATELAEGDGRVEIKLIPSLERNSLKVAATFGRIDATGMLGEALRSGSLGEDLRDKAAQTVLAAAQAGADFKIALPPAVRNSASVQSAKFQDVAVGGLSIVLQGQVEISDEQANQLASQLNQSLSAQGTLVGSAPETR